MEAKEIIFKLLTTSVTGKIDTSEFRRLKHNIDLVPKFSRNIKEIIDTIGKYRDDCYDIQGIKDDGIDVLVKYFKDTEEHRIGIQIKSFDDLQKEDWLSKLKAQLFETSEIWDSDDFYVIFCTDVTTVPSKGSKQVEKDKLRNGIADIQKFSNGKIHIVQPEGAMWLYNLDRYEIFNMIFTYLHNCDPVYKKACNSIDRLNEMQVHAIIDVIVEQFLENRNDYSLDDLVSNTDFDDGDFIYWNNFITRDDSDYIKYNYDFSWDLTSFVVDVKNHFSFGKEELKRFLFNHLFK